MREHHDITGPARGEPQPADHIGARVRVPLDSAPTPRWARVMTAHLSTGLTGHPAVGHLRLSDVVQGSDIVLQGVETREATLLGPVLRDAIEAANRACATDADESAPPNMPPAQAEEVARALTSGVSQPPRRSSAPSGGA